ncbi:hypothetical protein KR50_00760 [Jeotgalibacillus campisalis]|uniref:Uncharacterized protein n=1 Tax=Jeotgalibacillus campisalis TaxID=220754 RepID=A0A0C2VUZ9_9BACL|nr:hypothetical protein KR50_00760 [Jeotgalibacillus campisalis]
MRSNEPILSYNATFSEYKSRVTDTTKSVLRYVGDRFISAPGGGFPRGGR